MRVWLAAGWRAFYGTAKHHRREDCAVLQRWARGRNTRRPYARQLLTQDIGKEEEVPEPLRCARCWRMFPLDS